jgi:hypothetical protein
VIAAALRSWLADFRAIPGSRPCFDRRMRIAGEILKFLE